MSRVGVEAELMGPTHGMSAILSDDIPDTLQSDIWLEVVLPVLQANTAVARSTVEFALRSTVGEDFSNGQVDVRHTKPLCVSLMANVAYRVLSPIGNKLSNEVAANMLPVPNALQQSVESDVNLRMVMGQADRKSVV